MNKKWLSKGKSIFPQPVPNIRKSSLLVTNEYFAPQNTTPCFLEHFTTNTFCFSRHLAHWNILLINTHYSLTHFISQHTLLHSKICFLKHFVPKLDTGYLVIKGANCSKKQTVPESKVFQEEKRSMK